MLLTSIDITYTFNFVCIGYFIHLHAIDLKIMKYDSFNHQLIKVEFKRPLHPDVMLQPNNVTMMRGTVSDIEEDFFTLVIEQLQKHMNKASIVYKDLWGNPTFKIKLKEIAPDRKPSETFKRIGKMQKREFGYDFTNPETGNKVSRKGIVITTIDREGDNVVLWINVHAIPFLLYIGEGMTLFNKKSVLSIDGSHTKRIYKYLCSYKSKGGAKIKLNNFKEILGIENKYNNPNTGLTMFKKRVLEPAKKELHDNKSSDIYFDFDIKQSDKKSRKKDLIVFKIHYKEKVDKEDINKRIESKQWANIYSFLQLCIGRTNIKAQEITDKCSDIGQRFFKNRHEDALNMMASAQIDPIKTFNYFMKSAENECPHDDFFKIRYSEARLKK